MAFIRTLRGPARGRQPHFVPGSLACAAARPLALSANIRWAEPPHAAADADQDPAHEAPAPPLSDNRS